MGSGQAASATGANGTPDFQARCRHGSTARGAPRPGGGECPKLAAHLTRVGVAMARRGVVPCSRRPHRVQRSALGTRGPMDLAALKARNAQIQALLAKHNV